VYVFPHLFLKRFEVVIKSYADAETTVAHVVKLFRRLDSKPSVRKAYEVLGRKI
jgi:hypothetical protein